MIRTIYSSFIQFELEEAVFGELEEKFNDLIATFKDDSYLDKLLEQEDTQFLITVDFIDEDEAERFDELMTTIIIEAGGTIVSSEVDGV